MNQMARFFLTFLVVISLAGRSAFAEVNIVISDDYQAIHYAVETELQPGEYLHFHLPLNYYGDHYIVDTKTDFPGIELEVLDKRDIATRNQNPIPLLKQAIFEDQSIRIDPPPSESGAVGVLTNTSNRSLNITARVRMVGKRPKEVTENIKKMFAYPFEAVGLVYELPELSVFISPCAVAKTYPKVDIHICTELAADLSDKELSRALIPILLHELAYSLHYHWKLPVDINEEIADEFAVVILATSIPESLEDLICWLEQKDSIKKAVVSILPNKERTSYSIRRARNIQRIIEAPNPAMHRWAHLLSGHERERCIAANDRPVSSGDFMDRWR